MIITVYEMRTEKEGIYIRIDWEGEEYEGTLTKKRGDSMTEYNRCTKCVGTGRIYKDIFRGMNYEYDVCSDCNGTGKVEKMSKKHRSKVIEMDTKYTRDTDGKMV